MERDEFFTKEERELLFSLYKKLLRLTGETLQKGDCRKLKKHLIDSTQNNTMQRDSFGLNPVIKDMQTAVIVAEEIGMKLNRPMRVCGMVKNVGEPGGGPFLAYNSDGTISLQILESSQIDMNNPGINQDQ